MQEAQQVQPEAWHAALSQVASWTAVMLATAVLTASAAFANAAQLTVGGAAQRTLPQQVEAALHAVGEQITLVPAWLISLFGMSSEKVRALGSRSALVCARGEPWPHASCARPCSCPCHLHGPHLGQRVHM